MTEFNIKTKTSGKCRCYPDNPNGISPNVTSICGALMKSGLIDWAANCAVDYLQKNQSKFSGYCKATQDEWFHAGIFDCDNVRVFRGGSTVGGDSLSESMAKHSEPMQLVFGVNERRVSTFIYFVDLGDVK